MSKKSSLLRTIGKALSPDGTQVDFATFDKSVEELKKSLKQKIQAQTLDDVGSELEKFKSKVNLKPLIDAVAEIKTTVNTRIDELAKQIEDKSGELETAIEEKADSDETSTTTAQLQSDLADLKLQLSTLEVARKNDLSVLDTQIQSINNVGTSATDNIKSISDQLTVIRETETKSDSASKKSVKDLSDTLDALREELTRKLNLIGSKGGGGLNRQMFIGGIDPLTKWTDVNLKAGTGTTITYADNNTTQKVDVTITATGSGAGITRSINNTSISLTADATAGVDQVYIAAAGVAITMPSASLNGNLYTIKNTSTSSVLVARTGADTIDNDTSLILSTQYTSVDLVSDGFSNWNIT